MYTYICACKLSFFARLLLSSRCATSAKLTVPKSRGWNENDEIFTNHWTFYNINDKEEYTVKYITRSKREFSVIQHILFKEINEAITQTLWSCYMIFRLVMNLILRNNSVITLFNRRMSIKTLRRPRVT